MEGHHAVYTLLYNLIEPRYKQGAVGLDLHLSPKPQPLFLIYPCLLVTRHLSLVTPS